MTAFGMIQRSGFNLSPGSRMHTGSAAGGLGCAIAELNQALQWDLTLYGPCSCRSFDLIKSWGITPINRHMDDLPARVKELTNGKGVDVASDATGSEKRIRDSFAATVEGTGEVRVIGAMSSIIEGGVGLSKNFDTFEFLQRGILPRTRFGIMTHDYYYPKRCL